MAGRRLVGGSYLVSGGHGDLRHCETHRQAGRGLGKRDKRHRRHTWAVSFSGRRCSQLREVVQSHLYIEREGRMVAHSRSIERSVLRG